MIELIAQNLAPIMFVSVMAMLLLGYPVSFTLAAGGLIFFVIGVELSHLAPQEITLSWAFLGLHPSRTFDIMRDGQMFVFAAAFVGWFWMNSRRANNRNVRKRKVLIDATCALAASALVIVAVRIASLSIYGMDGQWMLNQIGPEVFQILSLLFFLVLPVLAVETKYRLADTTDMGAAR
ncbi:MAG: hypothetical protein AAGG69_02825 [Pseudomonadota bacterium]